MRKKALVVLSLCMVFSVIFTACGSGAPYSGVDLNDYIKVGDYKNVKKDKHEVKISDKDVKNYIETKLQENTKTEDIKSGTVKKNDTVKIDYEGSINGKKFDGGTAKDQSLKIGSGQFIEGFESQLIGQKVGSTKTIKVTFPKKYQQKDLAGKNAEFKVTVKAIQKITKPKLDKDFIKSQTAKSKTPIRTLAEYRKFAKEQLRKEREEQEKEMQKESLWAKVTAQSEVKKDKNGKEMYPEEELNAAVEKITKQYKDYAKQNKTTFEKLLKQMGTDKKTFNKQVKAYAESKVKDDMVTMYIAEKEDVNVDDSDCKAFVKKQLEQIQMTDKEYKERTGKTFEEATGKDEIIMMTYKDKVKNLIYKYAK